MKSLEAELGAGAAAARRAEQLYREQQGGTDSRHVEAVLGADGLSLEGASDERRRIADTNRRIEGNLQDFRITENELRQNLVEPGVNPNPLRTNELKRGTAREYFAKGPDDPLIESDAMAAERLRNPDKIDRIQRLKFDVVGRQADITNLESQIAAQTDAKMKAAQQRVLDQFKRELAAVQKELDDLAR